MSANPQQPLSTRTTKVKCCVCECLVPNEKSVYGVASDFPLMMPDHFCKMDAEIFRVQEFVPPCLEAYN